MGSTTPVQRVLNLFPIKPVRCPGCGLRIDGNHVWTHRGCLACGAAFRIRWPYFWSVYILALVASFAIAFAIGNRGNALSSLAILLTFATFWGMLMMNLRLFPMDIEIVAVGWTPGDSDRDRELEREFELLRELDPVLSGPKWETLAPVLEESADGVPGRLPLSTPRDRPAT